MELTQVLENKEGQKLLFVVRIYPLSEADYGIDSDRKNIQMLELRHAAMVKEEFGFDFRYLIDQDNFEPFDMNRDCVLEEIDYLGMKMKVFYHYVFAYAINQIEESGVVRHIRSRFRLLNIQFVNSNLPCDAFRMGSIIVLEDSMGLDFGLNPLIELSIKDYFGLAKDKCLKEASLGTVGIQQRDGSARLAYNPAINDINPIGFDLTATAQFTGTHTWTMGKTDVTANLDLKITPKLRQKVVSSSDAARFILVARFTFPYSALCTLKNNSAGGNDVLFYYKRRLTVKSMSPSLPEHFKAKVHSFDFTRDGYTDLLKANGLTEDATGRRSLLYKLCTYGLDKIANDNLLDEETLQYSDSLDTVSADVFKLVKFNQNQLEDGVGAVREYVIKEVSLQQDIKIPVVPKETGSQNFVFKLLYSAEPVSDDYKAWFDYSKTPIVKDCKATLKLTWNTSPTDPKSLIATIQDIQLSWTLSGLGDKEVSGNSNNMTTFADKLDEFNIPEPWLQKHILTSPFVEKWYPITALSLGDKFNKALRGLRFKDLGSIKNIDPTCEYRSLTIWKSIADMRLYLKGLMNEAPKPDNR